MFGLSRYNVRDVPIKYKSIMIFKSFIDIFYMNSIYGQPCSMYGMETDKKYSVIINQQILWYIHGYLKLESYSIDKEKLSRARVDKKI